MSFDDSHYFYVLHQIEFDLEIDHSELLGADRNKLDVLAEKWFQHRSNITGVQRKVSEDFKQGLFNWKEVERGLEEE